MATITEPKATNPSEIRNTLMAQFPAKRIGVSSNRNPAITTVNIQDPVTPTDETFVRDTINNWVRTVYKNISDYRTEYPTAIDARKLEIREILIGLKNREVV